MAARVASASGQLVPAFCPIESPPPSPCPLTWCIAQRGRRPSTALDAGLTSRIDEILLSLRPFSVTRGYWPGPHVAIFVPVKSSLSKNSQVPDRMIIEEMLLSHLLSRRISPTR
jgi:hypothetical protein